MPPPPLNLPPEQNSKSSATTKGQDELHLESSTSIPPYQSDLNGGAHDYAEEKNERSPTSPRTLAGFFKNTAKDRAPRRDGSGNNMSTSDLAKPGPLGHPYGTGSNNSTPSMSQSTALDETSSMRTAVSGIPESVRSDDEVNRMKTSSATNIGEHVAHRKGSKSTLPNMVQRSQSRRQNESQERGQKLRLDQAPLDTRISEKDRHAGNPLTAPPGRQERGFREALRAQEQARNRSADRSAVESEDETLPSQPRPVHAQTGFMSHFRTHGAKAADSVGRAGKGFFGKFKEGRSGSSHERDGISAYDAAPKPPFNVLTEPLKEQTRKTRIKKSMDAARDKTEFWMPALPYRCIDYLNHHGIESVGLYRIPGSAAEIKLFQQRFNSGPNYDVDMLQPGQEPQDLNVAASLLKAWVRDLPEPLLPKDVQDRIEKDAPGETQTPELMRQELSRLPPYNYYLLFAITCHMSLLHAHRDVNKMSYGALRTCWASLNVNAYIFQFLICDWRNCWAGCKTEQDQIQIETEILEGVRPPSPTPTSRLARGFLQSQPSALLDSPLPSTQSATRLNNTRSPERPERSDRPIRPERPERPERSTPPVPPNSATRHKAPSQPFSQDLGGKPFSPPASKSSKPSTPPNVGQIQQVSPLHDQTQETEPKRLSGTIFEVKGKRGSSEQTNQTHTKGSRGGRPIQRSKHSTSSFKDMLVKGLNYSSPPARHSK